MQESGLGTSGRYTTLLSIFALSGLILFLINFLSFTDIGILRLDHSKTEIISRADSILRKMGYTENRDYPLITAIYNTPLVDTIGMVVNQYLDQDYSFSTILWRIQWIRMKEEFGENRLINYFKTLANPDSFLDDFGLYVHDFTGGTRSDDQTAFLIQRK